MQKKQMMKIEMIGIISLLLFAAFIYLLTSRAPKADKPTPTEKVSFEEIARIASDIKDEYYSYDDSTMSFDDALIAISDYMERQTDYTKEEAETAQSKMYALMEEVSHLLDKIDEYYFQNGYHQK